MKGWRTVIFNGAIAVAGFVAIVAAYLDTVDLGAVLPTEWAAGVGIAVGLANVALRYITTSPIGKR